MTLLDPRLKREDLFIDGEWVQGGATVAVLDPATGETLARVSSAGAKETRRAIAAAARAFPEWKGASAAERAAVLRRLAGLISDNGEDLARLLTAEQGKPLTEARTEVAGAAAVVLWYAEEARRVYGEVVPSPQTDRRILVTREPVGVVAAITPWNFPTLIVARKVAAAVAAGCTIVLKPALQTPLSALAWGELCSRAGLPAGVFNCVVGDAEPIGAEMLASPLVRKVSFTGSTAVGKKLSAAAAATMKRVSMELGGNAPFIVFEDADLDRAVRGAMMGKYRNAGQTCVCVNRFLVHESVHDRFAERLASASAALRVGHGAGDGIEQGPLIDEAARRKVEALVAEALGSGARLLAGGAKHEAGDNFYQPTVLVDVSPEMAVAREEIFGPVAGIIRFRSEEEAVALANDTPYGLAAYFYTRDLARAFRVSEALEYGMVGVNEGLITTEVAPFGGIKESGMGREGGRQGIEDYLSCKYTCLGL